MWRRAIPAGRFAGLPGSVDTQGPMQTQHNVPTSGDDLSGRQLGGYRLVRRLGSGAMADVYLADQQSLGRQVAVKVLRPETLRHPHAVDRFAQEARAAASLVHGNIVQIHEVACVDGVHFLAEEYVAGPSLKAWLWQRGPLDAVQGLAVLAQVGSALAKSAQQGIVHRDIKPENLLVTPAGEVKVADFGLARVLASSGSLDLTQEGTALGTPLYMSPEQAEGRPVDTRSDLYSLGATVYHLLAGRPPFSGPTPLAVAMAHVRDAPVPIGEVRPELPSGLGLIIDRLLAKQPADRHRDPTELLRAVEAVEAAVAPGSRHLPSPLSWTGAAAEWRDAVVQEPGRQPAWQSGSQSGLQSGSAAARMAAAVTNAARAQATTGRVREATDHLQGAVERERSARHATRRFWLATGAAATAAFAAGFAIGRWRPRRSELFRPRR
jgi:serine/threonine protein kinase